MKLLHLSRFDREDPPLRQGFVLRSHALRVLRLLSQSLTSRTLELNDSAESIIGSGLRDLE